MYVDHWGLQAKPFEPSGGADAFLVEGESHTGAYTKLRYAIDERRAAAALAGPSGVGKTLLVRRLAAALDPETRPFVHAVFPQMSGRDLLAYLAERLGAPATEPPTGTVDESVRRLEDLVGRNTERGVHPVVVIDEAHLLEDSGALETLRLLLNFGDGDRPALTLLLVGQMGLLSSIARNPALDERIAVKTLLRGLTAEETADYVASRVSAAGRDEELFTPDAVRALHTLTGGVARRINRLADLALVVGFAEEADRVGAEQLRSVHRELVTVEAA